MKIDQPSLLRLGVYHVKIFARFETFFIPASKFYVGLHSRLITQIYGEQVILNLLLLDEPLHEIILIKLLVFHVRSKSENSIIYITHESWLNLLYLHKLDIQFGLKIFFIHLESEECFLLDIITSNVILLDFLGHSIVFVYFLLGRY